MEELNVDDVPTCVEEIRGNYSLHGYTEEYNKMAIKEIMMHHRSSRVFEMIDDSYNMTMNLQKSIRFNFGLLVQEKSLLEVWGMIGNTLDEGDPVLYHTIGRKSALKR